MRKYHFELSSEPLTAETIAAQDVVLLATDHSSFDYGLIRDHAQLIVDTRGVYLEPLANVVKA
jgi:UDP-N-acetyl-D-glucosamine dehydrogenase